MLPSSVSFPPSSSPLLFFRRNARLIAGASIFVMFWMLVYACLVYTPHYAAKAVVIIKDSAITGRYVEPAQYYALQTTSSSSSNPVLNTMGLLKSHAISNALWEYFSAKRPTELKKLHIRNKREWERFYQDGSAFIKAKNQPGTDLIAMQFAWSDPVIARETLGVVVKAFQDASRNLNQQEQISKTRYLNRQMTEIEKQLEEVRREKSAYQRRKRTVSLKREGDDLAAGRMELANKLSQLESQSQGKENLAAHYRRLLGMDSRTALGAVALGQNGTMGHLQDELYRLEQKAAELRTSLADTNPKVQEVLAQIEQTRASIAAEKRRTLGGASGGGVVADSTRGTLIGQMLQASGESRDLRGQANVIRGRLGQIDREIGAFPETAEALAHIDQKEASLSGALDQLRQKVLEGKLQEEQTLSNVFVVDAPTLPEKAQFPTRNHLLALGVMMGLGVGVSAAYLREQWAARRGAASSGEPPVDPSDVDPPPDAILTPDLPTFDEEPLLQPISPAMAAVERGEWDAILQPESQEPSTNEMEPSPAMAALAIEALILVEETRANRTENVRTDTPPEAPSAPAAERAKPLPVIVKSPAVAPSSRHIVRRAAPVDAELLESRSGTRFSSVKDTESRVPPLHVVSLKPNSQKDGIAEVQTIHSTPVKPEAQSPARTVETEFKSVHVGLGRAPGAANPLPETPEESGGTELYERHARTMPLPRRRNPVPSFLREGRPSTMESPYELLPRKTLNRVAKDAESPVAAPTPEEALPERGRGEPSNERNDRFDPPPPPVEPDSPSSPSAPPSPEANPEVPPLQSQETPVVPESLSPQALEELWAQALEAALPEPDPATGTAGSPPEMTADDPLPPLTGKPIRQPEHYFGLAPRSQRRSEAVPPSLSRMMRTLNAQL